MDTYLQGHRSTWTDIYRDTEILDTYQEETDGDYNTEGNSVALFHPQLDVVCSVEP